MALSFAQVAHVGERIRELREARGLSQRRLAEESGVALRTVQNIESGESPGNANTVARLSAALGIPVGQLVGDAPLSGVIAARSSLSARPTIAVGDLQIVEPTSRMVGVPVEAFVAAGHGGWDDGTGGERVDLPEFLMGPNHFVLKAVGDSMIDEGIAHGDYLIVERQPIAAHGELTVAWLNDGLVVKRWYRRNGRKFLESANAAMGWEPREITSADVIDIQGVVRHIVKKTNRIS